MPTVDFTIEDLKQVFATKGDLVALATKEDLSGFATKDDLVGTEAKLVSRIKKVQKTLEEDYLAEGRRLDRVDGRLRKLTRKYNQHMVSE